MDMGILKTNDPKKYLYAMVVYLRANPVNPNLDGQDMLLAKLEIENKMRVMGQWKNTSFNGKEFSVEGRFEDKEWVERAKMIIEGYLMQVGISEGEYRIEEKLLPVGKVGGEQQSQVSKFGMGMPKMGAPAPIPFMGGTPAKKQREGKQMFGTNYTPAPAPFLKEKQPSVSRQGRKDMFGMPFAPTPMFGSSLDAEKREKEKKRKPSGPDYDPNGFMRFI